MLKATVVISCYNQKDYIQDCLLSVLEQETNFEFTILVSDDCSTDGTAEVIKHYQSQYPEKITAILREKNVGPARNYIEAHQAASGDIIFHLDGDDRMLPQKLQKQYERFAADETVNLVLHRALYFSDDVSYQAKTGSLAHAAKISYFAAKDLALWGTIAVHSAYAYRRAARKLSDPKRDFMEWFFAMDALLPLGKGAYINEVLVHYRCNPRGSAYLASKAGRVRAYNIYFSDILFYFETQPNLRKELYANCLLTMLAMLKSGCGYTKGIPAFLLKHLFYFRLSNFKKTLTVRRRVGPAKKIR